MEILIFSLYQNQIYTVFRVSLFEGCSYLREWAVIKNAFIKPDIQITKISLEVHVELVSPDI